MFFAIVLSVLALAYVYVGVRLIRPWPASRRWKVAAWLVMVILYLLPPLSSLMRLARIESIWIDIASWMAYIGLGLFALLFIFVLIRDVIWWITLAGGRALAVALSRKPMPDPVTGTLRDPGRRQFIVHSTNLGVLTLSGGMTGYGFFEARRRPSVKRVTVPIRNLPPEFDGYTIVQITDIHVGPTVKRDWVEMIVETVNGIAPDAIAFTGDLVDGTVQHLGEDTEPMGDLRAPDGVYFVTGNHEYYSGVGPWLMEMRRLGLDVLLNEHRVLERGSGQLVLAGVTDWYGGGYHPSHRSDPRQAISGAPKGVPRILLAHQPRSIYEAVEAGYDLQISGHTHGGQFFPGNFIARIAQPYIEGLHRHGDAWIYVSRGTGYWGPPVRIGQPSEVTQIVLTV